MFFNWNLSSNLNLGKKTDAETFVNSLGFITLDINEAISFWIKESTSKSREFDYLKEIQNFSCKYYWKTALKLFSNEKTDQFYYKNMHMHSGSGYQS